MSDSEKNAPTPPRIGRRAGPALCACAALALAACGESGGDLAACGASPQTTMALAAAATGEMAALQVRERPEPVGPLAFQDDGGMAVSMDDFAGRTVLLNLWATWCAPCRVEMPAFDRLEADLGSPHFAIVPVSMDFGGAEKPKKFYADVGLDHLPFHHDGTGGVFDALKKRGYAFGLPATLLIDARGCVLASLNGPAEWAGADARAVVAIAIADSDGG